MRAQSAIDKALGFAGLVPAEEPILHLSLLLVQKVRSSFVVITYLLQNHPPGAISTARIIL
jgi:hypothetical protein